MKLHVNGAEHEVDAPPDMPLLWVLRDLMGLTGTKFGCGIAQCGACTVHVDGAPRRACVTPVETVAGKKITTIEGLSTGRQPSGAARLGRARRGAVRLLPVRPDHVGRGAAGEGPGADRRRHRPGAVRQHLPLRHLPAHPRGGASRGRSCGKA